MKILVVHRQKLTVEAIKSVLSGCNPVVRYTESGLDGLLTSRIEHFDFIICGTDLPVITGFELVRSLRTHSVNRNTRVVLIAEHLDEKLEQLAKALDVVAIIDPQGLGRLPELVIQKPRPVDDNLKRITKTQLN